MGGIADYSGSLVLEMPIAEATFAAVQKTHAKTIKIVSLSDDSPKSLQVRNGYSEARRSGKPADYDAARKIIFHANALGLLYCRRLFRAGNANWASIFKPAFEYRSRRRFRSARVLARRRLSRLPQCRLFVLLTISRSIHVQLALLCQKVENTIVGAPCGVMDQITAHCGIGKLTSCVCFASRPKSRNRSRFHDEIEFWGIDSGVQPRGRRFGLFVRASRRALMGYRIICGLAGIKTRSIAAGLVEADDSRWGGYLCNITPAEYERSFSASLPTAINGADFIEKFGGTTDSVTNVDPSKYYAVKAPTEHAIYENARVNAFAAILKGKIDDASLSRLGELMFQSHASYAACGLTESGTDRIVDLVPRIA